jgi:hypothetical protein
MTYYLPAPGQTSFVMPDCKPFREPALSWWTVDLTNEVSRQRQEMAREMDWDLEDRWLAHLGRQSRKQCQTPDVIYAAGYALPTQLTMFEAVA